MIDWEIKPIKSLGRVVTGKTPPKANSEYFKNGNKLFVSPKDLDWDQFYVTETETLVTDEALERFKNQVIPKNTIMFTSLSFAFGKMGIASQSCLTNQQINSVIVNSKHDFRFVYYLLKAYKQIIFSYNSGIDTPIVPKSVFEMIKVRCPSLEIQKKIANILTAYDELIDNNNQRISLLEQMAEEIYKEWFVRLRFPGHEQTRIVDGVPEGWEKGELGKIVSINMGQSPKSEFYNDTGDGLPFHQGVKDFGNRFPKHNTYCTDIKRIAEKNDILLSVRAPVGRLNIADRKLIIGRGLGAIKHSANFQSYCYYLLRCIFQIKDSFGNGAVFNAVSKKELAKIKISIPDQEIVGRFNKLVMAFDEEIWLLSEKNKILKQTRDLLLPRLMNGKLSVDHLLAPDS